MRSSSSFPSISLTLIWRRCQSNEWSTHFNSTQCVNAEKVLERWPRISSSCVSAEVHTFIALSLYRSVSLSTWSTLLTPKANEEMIFKVCRSFVSISHRLTTSSNYLRIRKNKRTNREEIVDWYRRAPEKKCVHRHQMKIERQISKWTISMILEITSRTVPTVANWVQNNSTAASFPLTFNIISPWCNHHSFFSLHHRLSICFRLPIGHFIHLEETRDKKTTFSLPFSSSLFWWTYIDIHQYTCRTTTSQRIHST